MAFDSRLRPHFSALFGALILFSTEAGWASWAVWRSVDALTDEATNIAGVTNADGYALAVYRLDNGEVWMAFQTPEEGTDKPALVLPWSDPPAYRIDGWEAHFPTKTQAKRELRTIRIFLWTGNREQGLSRALAELMSGKRLLIRYHPPYVAHRDVYFGLSGSAQAIASAIGIEPEVDLAAEARRREEYRRAQEAKRLAEVEKKRKESAERRARAAQLERQLAAEEERLHEQRREAELERQLAAEEERLHDQRREALDRLKEQYIASISGKVHRMWRRPPDVPNEATCEVMLSQIPGGEVVSVRVASCMGDEAFRRSVETAAYKASPLPAAPDPAVFDRDIRFTFAVPD